MANRSLTRCKRTMRHMQIEFQHSGSLPNAQAVTTLYLTLVDNNAGDEMWALWHVIATQVLGVNTNTMQPSDGYMAAALNKAGWGQ